MQTKLTARVVYHRLAAMVLVERQPGRKVSAITRVVIDRAGEVIARATLGGAWKAEQVLAELRRAPERFLPGGQAAPRPLVSIKILLGNWVVFTAKFESEQSVSTDDALALLIEQPYLFEDGPDYDRANADWSLIEAFCALVASQPTLGTQP